MKAWTNYNEGKTQAPSVFGSGYHKKADTLYYPTIDGWIIETVEVDFANPRSGAVSRQCNQNSEYHDRIIDLVNKNANLIRERMKAA